jgi:hypothetical protein
MLNRLNRQLSKLTRALSTGVKFYNDAAVTDNSLPPRRLDLSDVMMPCGPIFSCILADGQVISAPTA